MCDTEGFSFTPNSSLKSVHVKEWLAIGCSADDRCVTSEATVCPSERENCVCRRRECVCARATCCDDVAQDVYLPPIVNVLRTSPEQLYSQAYTFPKRPSIEGALVNDGNGQLSWEPLPLSDAWNVKVGATPGDVLVFDGNKWTPTPNCCAPSNGCATQQVTWDAQNMSPRLFTEPVRIEGLSLLLLQAPLTEQTVKCTLLSVQLQESEYEDGDDGLCNGGKYLKRTFTDHGYSFKTQLTIEHKATVLNETTYIVQGCIAENSDTAVQLPEHTLLFPMLEGPEELKNCCTLSLTYTCLPEPPALVPAPVAFTPLSATLAAFGTPVL